MPFINGKFYAKPTYGRALERARQADAQELANRLVYREPDNEAESENQLLPYHPSYGSQPEYEDLPYNPPEEPEFEEVAARQAGSKQQPAPQPKHVPNASHVTVYPHERKIGGSASWRNNNPANIHHGHFAHTHGAIGKDYRGRAVFPTMRAGEEAQDALWKSESFQRLTIEGAAKHWAETAPPAIQRKYADALAKAAGVPPNTPVSKLTQDQLDRLKQAQKGQEGFVPGITERKPHSP